MNKIALDYEFVVVGGGMSGLCAALSAARYGVKTALIHNRSVLGGNASSEFRMHICGASWHDKRNNLREGGILEEILLENKRINPNQSWAIWDTLLWSFCDREAELDLYLETNFLSVNVNLKGITSISCYQSSCEKFFEFRASFFCDATGDGALASRAGAHCIIGRESKDLYSESLAPAQSDNITMGSSLMFTARRLEHKVDFIPPSWAEQFCEEDLKNRDHSDPHSGYWWIELGGKDENTITDNEVIRKKLLSKLFGIWDHIKNNPGHNSDNLELDWISPVVGKRESRRVIGDYVLNQKDIDNCTIFDDAVAYGGWPMDIHTVNGLECKDEEATVFNECGTYTIPYRCYYSDNISNLFVVGRIISASHVAFSSTRVMGTCAIGGQAAGTAIAIAKKYNLESAREVSYHLKELQQNLLKDDCYIPGIINETEDKALISTIVATSGLGENVVNGITRTTENLNFWQTDRSDKLKKLTFLFSKEIIVHSVQLVFDSNFSREITPSIINEVILRQVKGTPPELVKTFSLRFFQKEKEVFSSFYSTNGQRLVRVPLENCKADKIELQIISSYGVKNPKVFEVRIY